MTTAARTTPKDVFLHLLAIGMLYASVTSLLTLLFQYINELFPDILTAADPYRAGAILDLIRTATAALIIVFPVYLLVSWLLRKDMQTDPGKAELAVRRWFLHLTIFLAAIIIIVDLVTLVYHFLSGELTARFLLKVLVILLTTAAVFWYELWELRKNGAKSLVPKRSAIASGTVVTLTIIGGFFLIGSPFYQRNVRFDERRVNDLQNLRYQIVSWWNGKDRLPTTLDELKSGAFDVTVPLDPESGQPYEYRVTGPLSFELCTTFLEAGSAQGSGTVPAAVRGLEETWKHSKGRTCFSKTIDPQIDRQQFPPKQ